MVYLSRIYTGSGDSGETGLGDGSRVPKDHPRVAAYGTVDELNAVLGIVATVIRNHDGHNLLSMLREIQNDLFDLGADLCMPERAKTADSIRIDPDRPKQLEEWIDEYNTGLEPLRSFILPGGTEAAAWLHLARTVCRRAERLVVTLQRSEEVNRQILIYLNRLSDLFFVLARRCNTESGSDVLWSPRASKKREEGDEAKPNR